MKLINGFIAIPQRFTSETLLLFAVFVFVLQLVSPSVIRWWNLPTDGTTGRDQFESRSIAREYLIYLPENYSNVASWPLVVLLHGAGERGDDINLVQKRFERIPKPLASILAAPQSRVQATGIPVR